MKIETILVFIIFSFHITTSSVAAEVASPPAEPLQPVAAEVSSPMGDAACRIHTSHASPPQYQNYCPSPAPLPISNRSHSRYHSHQMCGWPSIRDSFHYIDYVRFRLLIFTSSLNWILLVSYETDDIAQSYSYLGSFLLSFTSIGLDILLKKHETWEIVKHCANAGVFLLVCGCYLMVYQHFGHNVVQIFHILCNYNFVSVMNYLIMFVKVPSVTTVTIIRPHNIEKQQNSKLVDFIFKKV